MKEIDSSQIAEYGPVSSNVPEDYAGRRLGDDEQVVMGCVDLVRRFRGTPLTKSPQRPPPNDTDCLGGKKLRNRHYVTFRT